MQILLEKVKIKAQFLFCAVLCIIYKVKIFVFNEDEERNTLNEKKGRYTA